MADLIQFPDDASLLQYLEQLDVKQTVQIEFELDEEGEKFYRIFEALGQEARDRTWQHLLEVGKRVGVQ